MPSTSSLTTPPEYTPRGRARRPTSLELDAVRPAPTLPEPEPDDRNDALLDAARLARTSRASAGSTASTTTGAAPTPWSGRAATPPCCASRAPARASRSTTDGNGRYCYLDPYAGGAHRRGGGGAQRRLRRRRAGGGDGLPELRQPGEAGRLLPAAERVRRHGRGLRRARHAGHLAATSASTTRPTAGHLPDAGHRHAGHRWRTSRAAAASASRTTATTCSSSARGSSSRSRRSAGASTSSSSTASSAASWTSTCRRSPPAPGRPRRHPPGVSHRRARLLRRRPRRHPGRNVHRRQQRHRWFRRHYRQPPHPRPLRRSPVPHRRHRPPRKSRRANRHGPQRQRPPRTHRHRHPPPQASSSAPSTQP